MKKIALFPVSTYQRDKLSVLNNQELIALAENDDVLVLDVDVYLCNNNDECYYGEDWAFPISFPDKVWEVSCEWKTDCDGVQFETHLFHNLADAQEYFRKEREDRISDYQQYCDYVIERDDADAFYIQADEWDTYEQLWINEKEIK